VHPLRFHGRYPYSAITRRSDYAWPKSRRLAVYVGLNIEHFAFGAGLGACIGPKSHEPDILNYSWRDYGNRVGVWRCLDLFGQLGVRVGALINTALYDYCPEVIEACVKRGDELIGHGHTNSERQGEMTEMLEKALLNYCRERIENQSGQKVQGWLSPWISESFVTPDLLQENGYSFVMDWPADDQPFWLKTRSGPILSVPYPAELNDSASIIHRENTPQQFADMIVDQFDEMVEQCAAQPLVMTLSLHPFVVGQPFRLPSLRKALKHCTEHAKRERVWWTTPGQVADHCYALPPGTIPGEGPQR